MGETGAGVAVVTETWLKDGPGLQADMEDLRERAGLGMMVRNRRARESGVAYGGVACIWKESLGNFTEVKMKNPDGYEVLTCAGSLAGYRRKLVIIGVYIPPNYTKNRAVGAMDYVADAVVGVKRKYSDPFIIIAGDFNQWKISEYLEEFVDIKEAPVGATRNRRAIDKIFTNMSRSITECGTLAPLETEAAEDDPLLTTKKSDHRIAYSRIGLQRKQAFTWESYSYRHYNDESVEAFKDWMVMHNWDEVRQAEGSNAKAAAYQDTINSAIERYFPLKTRRKKSTDLPWMSRKILGMIDDRKRMYMAAGGIRTDEWKVKKREIERQIKERKKGYMNTQKEHILAEDANRNFFKHVKNFSRLEKPKIFDVREILPDRSDEQVAEDLAVYFNKVSREFEPLEPSQIPTTKPSSLPELQLHEVASRLRRFRKPKSMVPGDIFPKLVTIFADFLAIPLTEVYNCITRTKVWPRQWKKEFVTVIPKKPNPGGLSDVRNISCTMLASKVYE